jgi:hypothetical protein
VDTEAIARRVDEALRETKFLAPQQKVEILRGLSLRRTKSGIPVTSIHYSADPDRDPELNPEWKLTERKTYSSQGSWNREQEIEDYAGGGELVLADTIISHRKKLVIDDPMWRPDARWEVGGGFDHGRTNPTAFERSYIDFVGCIYMCGEYYMPGKEIWEHAAALKQMADIRKVRRCYADPSIFPDTHQQSSKEQAKSTNDLYVENGIALFSQFHGDRSDLSAAARILSQHWANLGPTDRELEEYTPEEQAEIMKKFRPPTLKIVCRKYSEAPQYGLHNWDSPNLLWEVMRLRKKKLTAIQLMTRNPTEAIVDKDNHAFDAGLKYWVMSLPEPTLKSAHDLAMEAIAHIPLEDVTSRAARYEEAIYSQQRSEDPVPMSKMAKRRMAMRRR